MNNTASLVNCVSTYTNTVMSLGRDSWGQSKTPLLADGLNLATREPARWEWGGQERIPSNFANQQHLLRVLVGLSTLSGEARWQEEAEAIADYALSHLQHETGLLHWGGHVTWDLVHDEPFGHAAERPHHELKCIYPFYELMWQVNPKSTQKYIEAYWDAHVKNWTNLDISRHGAYLPTDRQVPMWQDEFEDGPLFFVGEGLSFVNAGSDLYFAAAMLHSFSGQPGPLQWAKNLAKRYHDTANDRTDLVGYQFSQVEQDRAQQQLGPEFGEKALEGKILSCGTMSTRYAAAGLIQLQIGEELGVEGDCFTEWAHSELAALANHAYDFEANLLLPMFTDGTPIRPEDVKRPGYYSPQGFAPAPPNAKFFRTYATAYRITRDPLMARIASRIAEGCGLGDLALGDNSTATLPGSMSTPPVEVDLLYGVLEVWRATGNDQLREVIESLAERLVTENYRDGLFVPHPSQTHARFDSPIPLALLHAEAALQHGPDAALVPTDRGGRVDFSCDHDNHPAAAASKHHRVSDKVALYAAA